MIDHVPRVSIGLPVYNGENFLAEAIESVLAQTWTDWELIISDNASTDRSEEICREYAAADARIRYYRAEENRGVAWNFNRVFELARGEFFMWIAHDDLHAPQKLERSLEVLDGRPDVVVVGTQTAVIDERGLEVVADGEGQAPCELQQVPEWMDRARLRATASDRAWRRYYGVLVLSQRCYEVFGLMRASAIRRTRLHESYRGSDKVFLAEMALLGPFAEIPAVLFFSRWHDQRYSSNPSALEQQLHFNPRASRRIALPFQLRCSAEHLRSVFLHRIGVGQRALCLLAWLRWMLQLRKWPRVLRNLVRQRGDMLVLPARVRRVGRHPNCPRVGSTERRLAEGVTQG